MEQKLKVGILGATGMVGQRFISLLEDHPWFEVVTVAASPRSAGKTYEEAVGDRWKMDTPMPEAVKKLVVLNVNDVEHVASTVDFVFSAVDMSKEEIKVIEEAYAKTETPVVSNNSAHRWTPDVPMVVPEINAEHFEVIKDQKKRLGTTRGFIAVKPNCSIQSYAPCLAAWKEFGPKELVVTTYQAISGAGKTFKDWPEMLGNIIPFIGGEEEKSEQEPLRVLGKVENGEIVKAELPKITCQCVRVPVLNGHTAAVFINFEKKPTKEQLIEKLVNFKGFPQEAELPSAPKQFIQYLEEENRPQRFAVRAVFSCSEGVSADVRGGNVIPACAEVRHTKYVQVKLFVVKHKLVSVLHDERWVADDIPLEHLVPRCAVTAHEFQRALRHLIRENHVPGGACKVGVCLDVFVCHCCSLPFFTRTVEAAPRLFPCIIHRAHPVKGSIIHFVHSRRVDLRLMCFKFLRISATF